MVFINITHKSDTSLLILKNLMMKETATQPIILAPQNSEGWAFPSTDLVSTFWTTTKMSLFVPGLQEKSDSFK